MKISLKIKHGKNSEYLNDLWIVTFNKKKDTDTLIEQTKSLPQETFPFFPPINFSEEGEWLLAVTSVEATNFVFNITDENNSFSNSIPGQWNSRSA